MEGYPEWALRQGRRPEGQDWKREPLLIPDRDANRWEKTDPISQIEWTHDKNRTALTGTTSTSLKLVKWWWAQRSSGKRGVPKGYLVERLVGLHCPDRIDSVAEGFTKTLEGIQDTATRPMCGTVRPPAFLRCRNPFQRRLQASAPGVVQGILRSR